MPLAITFGELLAYNEEERRKWDAWLRAHDVAVFDTPLQRGGAFAAVWDVLDHIFVTERRHLQRLRGEYPLPEVTGVSRRDWDGLAEFAAITRREFVAVVESMAPSDADVARPVPIMGTQRMVSPRKLIFHVLLHEARHWAQISLAVRNAGLEPPADQDLVFSSALP